MNCELVRDLLPMYADSLLSASNADLVAAHLKTCPTCRRQLTQMQEPVEDVSIDEVIREIMVSRRKEVIKKGIIIGILIAALLSLIIGGWLYLEFRFEYSRYEVVSTDPELILSEVPELALTDAEIELGQIIFDIPEIANAEPPEGLQIATLETVPEEISEVFPGAFQVEASQYVVFITCMAQNTRFSITYLDGDQTGNADRISKMTILRDENGEPITSYSVDHYPGLRESEYSKSELKHVWFGFLQME